MKILSFDNNCIYTFNNILVHDHVFFFYTNVWNMFTTFRDFYRFYLNSRFFIIIIIRLYDYDAFGNLKKEFSFIKI